MWKNVKLAIRKTVLEQNREKIEFYPKVYYLRLNYSSLNLEPNQLSLSCKRSFCKL